MEYYSGQPRNNIRKRDKQNEMWEQNLREKRDFMKSGKGSFLEEGGR